MSILDLTASDQMLAKRYMTLARWFEVVGDPEQAKHCRERMDGIWQRLERWAMENAAQDAESTSSAASLTVIPGAHSAEVST